MWPIRFPIAALSTCFMLGIPVAALAAPPSAVMAPIDPYPQSHPSPVDQSRPPLFLDDDETVRVKMAADGSLTSLVDDVLLKLRGSGDYALFLPGKAKSVSDLGGDSVPGLQDGHVSFLGYLSGQSQLGAEATLDRSAVQKLPLAVHLTYEAGGRSMDGGSIATSKGPITVHLEINNLTRQAHQFFRGKPDAALLAVVLEDLRQAPGLYSPETDLNAVLPLPAALPLTQPVVTEQRDTYVPFAISVGVRLPAGTRIVDSGGSDVTVDPRGAQLVWGGRLPEGQEAAGTRTFAFTYSTLHPRIPAIEIKAEPAPLPASIFTPPGNGRWATYLSHAADRSTEAVLAQEGAASLHRIEDLVPPVGRPGPGPVKVKYDYVLESGHTAVSRAPTPPPVRGQPWAVLLAIGLFCFALMNGVWSWSRH